MLVYEDAESDDDDDDERMNDQEDDSSEEEDGDYGEEEIKQIPIVKKRAKLQEVGDGSDDDLEGDDDLYGDEGLGLDDDVSDEED